MCVCVQCLSLYLCVLVCVAAGEEIYRDLRDFKPILDLDLYGEHMLEERITGSKISPDLYTGSTYTQVYMVLHA